MPFSTSLCFGIPGCPLTLRRSSMTVDMIGYAVLFGIALGFSFVQDLNSSILIVSVTLFGPFSILLTEWIALRYGAAQNEVPGLVFPTFFAPGVILVARCFRNVHLNMELILMGSPPLAPSLQSSGLPRMVLFNSLFFAANLTFAGLYFRPLCYVRLDSFYAILLGLSLQRTFYVSLILGALSVVVAFQSVGTVLLTISFVVVAAATSLPTRSPDETLLLTLAVGVVVAVLGNTVVLRMSMSFFDMRAALFLFILLLLHLLALLRNHQHDTDNQKDGAE